MNDMNCMMAALSADARFLDAIGMRGSYPSV
jgi:hypothetical protein